LCDRNKAIEDLKAQLAASQKVERILLEGLHRIIDVAVPDAGACNPSDRGEYEDGVDSGLARASDIARDTFKAAEEVK